MRLTLILLALPALLGLMGCTVTTCPGGYALIGTTCEAYAAGGSQTPSAATPPVVPVQSGAANTIRQFGGEVLLTIDLAQGFNNALYQSRVSNQLLTLPTNLQGGAGVNTVNGAGQLASEIWEQDPEFWLRQGGLRPQTITIATFDRGTARWRDEIWLNNRRVAICPVSGIDQLRLDLEEGVPGLPLSEPFIRSSECRQT